MPKSTVKHRFAAAFATATLLLSSAAFASNANRQTKVEHNSEKVMPFRIYWVGQDKTVRYE